MMENYDNDYWENTKCPKYDCRKNSCKCGLKKVFLAAALGDDGKDSSIAPKNGAYCNAIVVYEANNHVYIYSKEGIPTLVETGGSDVEDIIKQLENQLAQEILNRQSADDALQQEIDDIKNSPDVVDIVPTYAALQTYDTSSLGNNDIVRVLQDEQHDGQSTYYRWSTTTQSWTYIGAVGDYYTKGQVDDLLDSKQNVLTAGANIQISAQNEISATNTTYDDFTGATASTDGVQGLVPGPLAGDEDKFLKADGTWATVGGGGGGDTVYSNETTSNSAAGGAVYIGNLDANQDEQPDPTTTDYHYKYFWALPKNNTSTPATNSVCILGDILNSSINSIAIGSSNSSSANARGTSSIAIGPGADAVGSSIALGQDSYAGNQNININNTIAIGSKQRVNASYATVIGANSSVSGALNLGIKNANSTASVVIGKNARVGTSSAGYKNSVALGSYSAAERQGEVNIGLVTDETTGGYNNTAYRVIGGVHDGQLAHDAVTVNQVNATIDAINTALSTNIPHIGA